MKPVTVKDWTAALRSGEYEQGKGCLEDAIGRMCCIGVLCALAGERTRDDELSFGLPIRSVVGGVEWDAISHSVYLRYGRALPEFNDSGTPFAEIADMIEAVTQ